MPLDPDTPLGRVPYDPKVYGSRVWALSVSCVCGERIMPLRILRKKYPLTVTAPQFVARMRCELCKERPSAAAWVQTPNRSRVEERVEIRPAR